MLLHGIMPLYVLEIEGGNPGRDSHLPREECPMAFLPPKTFLFPLVIYSDGGRVAIHYYSHNDSDMVWTVTVDQQNGSVK